MSELITFGQAYNLALAEAMENDEQVILLGEDVGDEQGGGVFKTMYGLSGRFGTDRVRSTPIAEQAILGAAVGSAIAGYRPVADIMFMNFLTVCMDQLVNHAAKLRFMSGGQTAVPLTVTTTTGTGRQFGGQHSDWLEAWLAHVPGLKVVTPSTPADAKALLLASIEDDDPTIFIQHIALMRAKGAAPAADHRVPLGKAAVVREGTDITVISYGARVRDCLQVAERLADQVSIEVVDLRTIAPFDEETVLRSVVKTQRAVVMHEAVKAFGVGAEIASRIHEELFGQLKAPVHRVGSKYSPVPFNPGLEQDWTANGGDLEVAIRKVMG
ncbi:MAG: transketolase C-terminal domain-containing protein [Pseudomonadota bacterium]